MDIDEVDFKILEVCSEESKDSSSNEDSSAFSSLRLVLLSNVKQMIFLSVSGTFSTL